VTNRLFFFAVYYDAVNLRVRWDRVGNLEKSGQVQSITTWTDYSKGGSHGYPEYVYFITQGTCEVYGADKFNEWCYGPQYDPEQLFVEKTDVLGQTCSIWKSISVRLFFL
jgi:hypothetical protein